MTGFWKIGAMLIGAGVLTDGVVYHSPIDFVPAADRLPASIRAYRGAGFYWTGSEVGPHLDMDDPQNAAMPMLYAMDALRRGKSLAPSDIGTPHDAQSFLKGEARRKRAWDLFEAATYRPHLDFGWDLGLGYAPNSGQASSVSWMGSFLCTRAKAEAILGDWGSARADFGTALRLASLMGQEPLSVAAESECAIDQEVLENVQICAGLRAAHAPTLKGLIETVDSGPFNLNLKWILKSEAYNQLLNIRRDGVGFGSFLSRLESDPEWSLAGQTPPLIPEGIIQQAYYSSFLETWAELAPMIDGDADPKHLRGAVDAVIDTNLRRGVSYGGVDQMGLDRITDLQLQLTAHFRTTHAFLESMLIHQRTGSFPRTIDQVPGNVQDPYSDSPLLISQSNGGFRVYSVGENGKDEGGVDGREQADQASDDIVAAFPPIKLRKYNSPPGSYDGD